MSHIDSYDHSEVGILFGIPLYHPLADIDMDFGAPPANSSSFILGGGSGEHSAMIIRHLNYCLFMYLEFIAEQRNIELSDCCPKYAEQLDSLLNAEVNKWTNLEYQWSMNDVSNLVATVNQDFSLIPLIEETKNYYDPEQKILIMVGEIVHQHAIHLLNIHDIDALVEVENLLDKNTFPHWKSFKPAVSGQCAGRYLIRDENGTEVVWGLNFKDEDMVYFNLSEVLQIKNTI